MHIDPTVVTARDRGTLAELVDARFVEASLDGVVAELSVRDVVTTTVEGIRGHPSNRGKLSIVGSTMKFFEDVAVGDAFESQSTYRVTAEEIKNYAAQWDPMPYHLDEEEAKKTVVGQLFAPSMFTLSISTKLTHDTGYYEISTVAGLGIDEVRMPKPVLVEDQLKVKVAIVSMRESKSKPGLGVITTRHTVINQRGEVVLSYLLSALVYKRPH